MIIIPCNILLICIIIEILNLSLVTSSNDLFRRILLFLFFIFWWWHNDDLFTLLGFVLIFIIRVSHEILIRCDFMIAVMLHFLEPFSADFTESWLTLTAYLDDLVWVLGVELVFDILNALWQLHLLVVLLAPLSLMFLYFHLRNTMVVETVSY